jgi:hypothetical protein
MVLSYVFAFEGFQNPEEAQAELDRMYGNGLEDGSDDMDRVNHLNSISKFVEYVLKEEDIKINIVYSTGNQHDAALILKSFILRRRNENGKGNNDNGKNGNGISVIKKGNMDFKELSASKSFILGCPFNNTFIRRMPAMEKINISGAHAQFKLFDYPNCITIACKNNNMFNELIRVFIRSFQDFDEDSYIYFFQK